MLKKTAALFIALIIPFLLFVLVISLNESVNEQEQEAEKQVNFNVNQQKKIQQQKPKPKPKPKRRQTAENMPSIKPTNIGSSLSGSGLSFGIPMFDEAKFSDIGDGGLLDNVAGKTMDRDSVDIPPKVLKRSPIVYPELARRQGISGYVTMNVLINESGNVENVEVIDSKPEEIFDLKAENTIRRWKFEPASYNGKKVKVWAMQKIVFKLN